MPSEDFSAGALFVRRALAFALDWLLIALWGGALFGAVMLASGGQPQPPGSPWSAQGIGLVAMTIPVCPYFAWSESSAAQASFGKRVLGLVVRGASGERLAFGRALLRNALKLAPWECGHTLAQQAIHSGDAGIAPWVWAPAIVAFAGPLWWMGSILASGRAPYDRWTHARVQMARAHE